MKPLSSMTPTEIGRWINKAQSSEERSFRKISAYGYLYGASKKTIAAFFTPTPRGTSTMTRRTRPRSPASPVQASTATISIPRDNPSRSREKQINIAKRCERAARKQYEEALSLVQALDPLALQYTKAQTTLEEASLLLIEVRTTLRQVLTGVDVQVDLEDQE